MTRHIGLRLLLVVAVTFPMLAFPASVFAAQTCRYVNYTVSYKIASNANLYSTTGWVKLKKYFCVENGEFTHYTQSQPAASWSSNSQVTESVASKGNWDVWFSQYDKGSWIDFRLQYKTCTHDLELRVEVDNDLPLNARGYWSQGGICFQDTMTITGTSGPTFTTS